ncbi:Uma2 family endonuclease [Streptomyces sp. CC208A]|uniref:Uma2 family endonuclease n=1 Tax=Streptomyces sp. CC208A TaxID=3044573 RepID=UPI0024A88C7A|nr:Uma2 family endonuclease [Streptomyces sp. CC208A]
MTAEPTTRPEHECAERWPRPPQDGWTVDDLLTLPGLPPHTEMIDGSLVFVSPQRRFHSAMIFLLRMGLHAGVPPELRVDSEMTVVIDRRNGPEPDVLVVRKSAVKSWAQTSYPVADVVLAVEVVSPESEARDRDTKPSKYAAAGIEHFWLVEMEGEDDHAVVHVYELDPVTKTYACTGIHRDRLKLSAPFPIDIDLTEIDEM